jgi:hypothetical protein
VIQIISVTINILVTPKAGAKQELLFNKPVSDKLHSNGELMSQQLSQYKAIDSLYCQIIGKKLPSLGEK